MTRRTEVVVALGAGGLLALAGLAAWGLAALADPRAGASLGLVFGIEIAAGREAAIPAGLAAGLPWLHVALFVLAIEWSMLLLGFPLLVLLGDWLHGFPRVRALFARAEAYARAHPATGVLTLGALTLAPFLPVGALTSVVVGEFLRLPMKRLLPVLLGAELVANLGFAAAAGFLLGFVAEPRLVAGLASLLLLLGAAVSALATRHRDTPGPATP